MMWMRIELPNKEARMTIKYTEARMMKIAESAADRDVGEIVEFSVQMVKQRKCTYLTALLKQSSIVLISI